MSGVKIYEAGSGDRVRAVGGVDMESCQSRVGLGTGG